MMLSTIVIIGVVLYAVFVISVGVISKRQVSNMKDFALGSGFGPIALGIAFSASWFSAGAMQGFTGYAYAWGYSSLWLFLAIFGGATVGFLVIGKGVSRDTDRLKVLTLADWVGENYKSDIMRFIVAAISLLQVFNLASQFSSGGTLLHAILPGINYRVALIAVATVTTVYALFGGMFSDVYTSMGQMLIMMFIGLFCLVSVLGYVDGGFVGMSERLATQNVNLVSFVNPDSLHVYSWQSSIVYIEVVVIFLLSVIVLFQACPVPYLPV